MNGSPLWNPYPDPVNGCIYVSAAENDTNDRGSCSGQDDDASANRVYILVYKLPSWFGALLVSKQYTVNRSATSD